MLKFALLNFKRTKKSWRLLMGVMILAYTFLTMLLIFFSSMHRSEEEQRERLYGSWHVALINTDGETMRKLEHHATLERMGASRIYGRLLDQAGEELGKAGTADSNTMQMENIELMEGRFPQAEDEAAVERSSLSALGIEPRLGETIEARLSVRDGGEETVITRTYKVVGILQDYSEKLKGTTPDKHDYVTLLVTEQSSLSGYGERWNLVCRLQEKYLKDYRDITAIREYQGTILANNYTYFSLGEESEYQWRRERGKEYVCLGIAVISILGIWNYVIHRYWKEEIIKIERIKKIGGDTKRVKVLEISYLLIIHIISGIVGNCLGIVLSYVSINLWGYSFWKNDIWVILLQECVLFIGINLGLLVGSIKKKAKIRKQLRSDRYIWRDKGCVLRYFARKTLKDLNITIILVTCIWGISLYWIEDSWIDYEAFIKSVDSDYIFGTLYSCYPIENGISNEEMKVIKDIYGVGRIESYKTINYRESYWTGQEQSDYIKTLEKYYWPKYTGSPQPQCYICGIDNKVTFDYYNSQLDEGNLTSDEFFAGESVIAYIPNIEINNKETVVVEKKNRGLSSGTYSVEEDSIGVGSEIWVNGDKKYEELRIGGIIREFKDNNTRGKLASPYTIIMSEKLFNRLKGDESDWYAMVLLGRQNNTNYIQTDLEINQLSTNAMFFNNRTLEEELIKKGIERSIIVGLIGGAIGIILLWIQKKKFRLNTQVLKRDLKVLFNIGFEYDFYLKTILYEFIKSCAISVTLSCGIILGIEILDFYFVKSVIVEQNGNYLFQYLVSEWLNRLSGRIPIIMLVLFLVILGIVVLIKK